MRNSACQSKAKNCDIITFCFCLILRTYFFGRQAPKCMDAVSAGSRLPFSQMIFSGNLLSVKSRPLYPKTFCRDHLYRQYWSDRLHETLQLTPSHKTQVRRPLAIVKTPCHHKSNFLHSNDSYFSWPEVTNWKQEWSNHLKKMAQDPSSQSWNLISPSVVSAVKSGTMSPRRRVGILTFRRFLATSWIELERRSGGEKFFGLGMPLLRKKQKTGPARSKYQQKWPKCHG